jgi:hypothetical protein
MFTRPGTGFNDDLWIYWAIQCSKDGYLLGFSSWGFIAPRNSWESRPGFRHPDFSCDLGQESARILHSKHLAFTVPIPGCPVFFFPKSNSEKWAQKMDR